MDPSESVHPAIQALKTVCRCNNIKYRTIERAILQGACSLGAVAARTTATTGECGGTCTPEVQQMIMELAPPVSAPAVTLHPANAWWVRKK